MQRWEKVEKLPVRRHLHEKQGTIYAFKSEIDAWSQGRQLAEDEIEFEDSVIDGGAEASPPNLDTEERSLNAIGDAIRRLPTPAVKRYLIVLAVAAAGALGAHLLWPQHKSGMVAVLPFQNLGGFEQQALVDGFTTETKIRLEQVQPDRMGVLLLTKRYAELPVDEVAAEFNAAYVLQGTATIVGQKVSITARLIRSGARSGTAVWHDQYEGDLRDIQRIQSEVSAAIAKAVLSEIPEERPTRQIDPVAYEAYQWGSFFLNKRTTPDLLKALDYFQKAAHTDPQYAPAYAGLAAS